MVKSITWFQAGDAVDKEKKRKETTREDGETRIKGGRDVILRPWICSPLLLIQ